MSKIFGIGLSRTGTTSLTHALKQVGINIIHYPHNKAQLFDPKSDGACDIPVITYYKELDRAFPNSKFIYTFREKEEWLNSMSIYLPRKKNWTTSVWQTQHRMAVYGRTDFDRDAFAERYDFHNNDVRSYFRNRSQDFLVIDIVGGETQTKLLEFLDIETDGKPIEFPFENKRDERWL